MTIEEGIKNKMRNRFKRIINLSLYDWLEEYSLVS